MRDAEQSFHRVSAEQPANPAENLILLLSQHQEQLFRYIFSLVPVEADARDILQETSLSLFRKFGQYDASRWADASECLGFEGHVG